MATEIKITCKDDSKTNTIKYLHYEGSEDPLIISRDSAYLKSLIGNAKVEFNGEPEDITVRVSLVW
jgi:hypothetical protein